MIGIICASISNIIEYFFSVETVALGHSEKTDGSEGAFGIDVEAFTLTASHGDRKLDAGPLLAEREGQTTGRRT